MSNTDITISPAKCLKDGICISVCPCGIFKKGEAGIPAIDAENALTCIKCGHCMAVCPGSAISVKSLNLADFQSVPVNKPTLSVFANLLKYRRSIRSFKPAPVELDKLIELIELTRYCPTAKNTQALSWLIINGAEKVNKFSAAVVDAFRNNERMKSLVDAFDRGEDPVHRGAPQVAVIYGSDKYPWGTLDATIAVANLELAANTSGIGTCWGGFSTWAASNSKEVGKSIGLADDEKIFAVIMIGYAKYAYRLVPPRKPLRLRTI